MHACVPADVAIDDRASESPLRMNLLCATSPTSLHWCHKEGQRLGELS